MPVSYAALVRPVLGRVHFGVRYAAEFPDGSGLMPDIGRVLLDRARPREAFAPAYRYRPTALRTGWDAHVAAGHMSPDGELTGAGRDLVRQVSGCTAATAARLWKPAGRRVSEVSELTGRILAEATRTPVAGVPGGSAFAVMGGALTGTHEPLALAERIAALRYHRADAHAAAWASFGLDEEAMLALGPGERREEIEAETNARDAAPYAVLSEADRWAYLAGLGALPG